MATVAMVRRSITLALATILCAATARAGVTPEEAAALGTTLTPVGAEMAGNAAGTIPAFTGGLAPPASYKPGDGGDPTRSRTRSRCGR